MSIILMKISITYMTWVTKRQQSHHTRYGLDRDTSMICLGISCNSLQGSCTTPLKNDAPLAWLAIRDHRRSYHKQSNMYHDVLWLTPFLDSLFIFIYIIFDIEYFVEWYLVEEWFLFWSDLYHYFEIWYLLEEWFF